MPGKPKSIDASTLRRLDREIDRGEVSAELLAVRFGMSASWVRNRMCERTGSSQHKQTFYPAGLPTAFD